MGTVIPFPLLNRENNLNSTPITSQPIPSIYPEEGFTSYSTKSNNCIKINDIEEELLKFVDESFITTYCDYNISEKCLEAPNEETSSESDVSHLEKLIVFSPEIQQEGFAKSESKKDGLTPCKWGDVFVKNEDEYPFLFTIYTAGYIREQFRQYGERITPSSRDVILNTPQLSREDIIRAVIKWVNLHCPTLKGKPIFLEKDAILQTLICDPGVEIICPDQV